MPIVLIIKTINDVEASEQQNTFLVQYIPSFLNKRKHIISYLVRRQSSRGGTPSSSSGGSKNLLVVSTTKDHYVPMSQCIDM